MKHQHLLFYDEFDDPVLDSLHGHIPNRALWTVVSGNDDHTHLVRSELRLDATVFDEDSELYLRTPIMPADVRIEALFHFLDGAPEVPYFGIYSRLAVGNTDYAGLTVWPTTAGAIYGTWHVGSASLWDEQNLAWGSMAGCDIYTELTAVGRELSFKFVNLTLRNETFWHYTIPESGVGSYRYCALRMVPGGQRGGFAEHGCKYFKVFGADKAE